MLHAVQHDKLILVPQPSLRRSRREGDPAKRRSGEFNHPRPVLKILCILGAQNRFMKLKLTGLGLLALLAVSAQAQKTKINPNDTTSNYNPAEAFSPQFY